MNVCPDCQQLTTGDCGKHHPAWIARERDALGRLVAEVAIAEALSHVADADLEGTEACRAYDQAIRCIFDAYRKWRRS